MQGVSGSGRTLAGVYSGVCTRPLQGGMKPRRGWGRWKEKGARLGAALATGHILDLAFQLVPGVSFSSQKDKTYFT